MGGLIICILFTTQYNQHIHNEGVVAILTYSHQHKRQTHF